MKTHQHSFQANRESLPQPCKCGLSWIQMLFLDELDKQEKRK